MSRIVYSILFLITFWVGCRGGYVSTEKQSGFIEIKKEKEDPDISQMIQPYRDSIYEEMETVIGKSDEEMKSGQPESLLGNFCCDLMLNLISRNVLSLEKNLPTMTLLNYRGLRAPLPKGDIKVKNIYEIMPFENKIVFAKLTGKSILEMCRYLIDFGGHPVSANFKLTVKADKSFTAIIDGKEIDTNAIYQVITTDYLLNGGDNMLFFSKSLFKGESELKFRDFLMEEIKSLHNNGKTIKAEKDGRITFK